jgi:hypothetical protein
MTLWALIRDAGVTLAAFFAILWLLYRVVQWARARSKRAYVVGALFAPFMGMGNVSDPEFRIVNEAKQHKKREEDDAGDPPDEA